MTDGWARPKPTIDVPLTVDDEVGDDDTPTGPEPNWRKITGLASLGGVALGIVVSVIVLAGGDDDETPPESPTTTLDPATVAALVTTPPTLPSAQPPTIPPAGASDASGTAEPAAGANEVAETLPAPSFGDDDLFAGIDIPSYPAVDGMTGEALAEFDFATAILASGEDVPRRATTTVVVGRDGFALDATVARDVQTDRFEMTVSVLDVGFEQQLIVDVASGFTYVATGTGEGVDRWERFPSDELAAAAGLTDMRSFVEPLLLGPIRLGTTSEAIVSDALRVVLLDGQGPEAREFRFTVDAATIPQWAPYALGPTDAPRPLPDDPVSFTIYVTDSGEIRRTIGASAFGTTAQVIVHDVQRVDDVSIELPPTELVTEATVASR